ncbi:uncharacterized protein LOC131439163 isoform X2 [Malaya genurostris]|nr:uncharacterized protein LOC131439163 isoform X2 [Malaya genurostris]XP_058465844.1 uncharacterized protein LOC131439163 isoform X2 [Malaya genurostris]
MLIEAGTKPCDVGSGDELELKLPQWYDDAKFKRGQKYFFDNRFGMMQSNFCGLVTLLCEPKGLIILHNTGRSSTPETARKRYLSTLVHMLSWYEMDLSPGSKSWISLNRVRKMHLYASKKSEQNGTGFISQMEIAFTTFGFMGYALIRPHLLGIRYDNDEDRDALVHFWAVIGAMLGVEDQYNICLPKLAVVEMICQMCIRYVFMPLLQFETPLFKTMVTAIVKGLSDFVPFNSYESMMWFVRRVAGIPGYQYMVDMEKETICRKIYNNDELNSMYQRYLGEDGYQFLGCAIFDERIMLFDVEEMSEICEDNPKTLEKSTVSGVYSKLYEDDMLKHKISLDGNILKQNHNEQIKTKKLYDDDMAKLQVLSNILKLKGNEQLTMKKVENENAWKDYLNDSKLKVLSNRDLGYLKLMCRLSENCYSRIGNFINETILSLMIYRMKKAHEKY